MNGQRGGRCEVIHDRLGAAPEGDQLWYFGEGSRWWRRTFGIRTMGNDDDVTWSFANGGKDLQNGTEVWCWL